MRTVRKQAPVSRSALESPPRGSTAQQAPERHSLVGARFASRGGGPSGPGQTCCRTGTSAAFPCRVLASWLHASLGNTRQGPTVRPAVLRGRGSAAPETMVRRTAKANAAAPAAPFRDAAPGPPDVQGPRQPRPQLCVPVSLHVLRSPGADTLSPLYRRASEARRGLGTCSVSDRQWVRNWQRQPGSAAPHSPRPGARTPTVLGRLGLWSQNLGRNHLCCLEPSLRAPSLLLNKPPSPRVLAPTLCHSPCANVLPALRATAETPGWLAHLNEGRVPVHCDGFFKAKHVLSDRREGSGGAMCIWEATARAGAPPSPTAWAPTGMAAALRT